MANVTEQNLQNHGEETDVVNYISQINAGGTVYDIATHHGIVFKNGSTDATGITWNGLTDLEVVIPSIADIVKKPIEFVGTVGSDGTIKYNNGATSQKEGNLVFISADCTFSEKVCEAGDMAIYDGESWIVVSGENQVTLIGAGEDGNAAITLNSTAKEILNVEGKKLSLNVDFTAVKDVLSATVDKNAEKEIEVVDGTVTVAGKYIKLTHSDSSTETIGKEEKINLPTALKDGTVTIADKVLVADDIELTDDGAFPEIVKNSAAISISASTSIAISKQNADGLAGDFISSIDGAVKSVGISVGTYGSAQFDIVSGYSKVDGNQFVNGIHEKGEEDGEKTADFYVPGDVSISGTKTFATGFGDAAASGEVVSSVTVGAVTVSEEGTTLLRGLDSTEKNDDTGDVITSVSFGTVEKVTGDWFYNGLTGTEVSTGWDVVTSVSTGAVTLNPDANGGSDAFVSASVSDHVLSFSTAKFQTPVKISQAATTVKGKTFTSGAISLSGFAVKSANFLTGSIAQASTAISYKTLNTDSFDLSIGASKGYIFDKAAETTYSFSTKGIDLDVKNAVISTASYSLVNTGITANIPANSVAVSLSGGHFPELSIGDATGTISGTVDTALASTEYSWIGLASTTLSVAGGYSLIETSTAEDGVTIAVAVAGEYDVDDANITIPADTYVTGIDIKVSDTSIITPKTQA